MEDAFWHLSSGKEFKEAFYILISKFDVINSVWKEQVDRPSYYCAGLAVEHFLKSYLSLEKIIFPRNHGGHNLNSLLSLGGSKLRRFFNLDYVDIKQIGLLNERYYNHESYGKDDLRYGKKSGLRKSPHPDSLNMIVNKMNEKLMIKLSR